MNPLISVIIATYQHAGSLPGCLDSVLAQEGVTTEIIVVDDGSTDNTVSALQPYEGKITLIRQDNRGANPARNRGRKEAKGEYVIFVDADIIMVPHMLATMLADLQAQPDASFAYSSFRFGWKHFRGVPWNVERLRRSNFAHTTSLVRRADFPGFDEQIRRFQDWDVWLTMAAAGKSGVLVPGTLFHCRIEGASRIGSSWLPSFVYRLPWSKLPWVPRRVAKYEAARDVIVKKHQL